MRYNLLIGLERGVNFFEAIGKLGLYLLAAMGVVTMTAFWVTVVLISVTYSQYAAIRSYGLLLLTCIEYSVIMFLAGTGFKYFFYFWKEYIFNKHMAETIVQQHGKNKRNKKITK